ncbi:uncharacterized protein LOC125141395 isoform X1 [Tachysurus fulvidraco]|uniref:uncharacterized protein LOC125141395 isoform X1 n=1 Tax=Tachysurus fulvidraco TaxID=1234273 RepID=UPI001FEEF3BA|nr:uncharacterized protein LOC125141395 isoform X1 [Tachysurus fulvidraco]
MMEEKQKAAERQAEGLIKKLEKEISVLKRRDTELEQLSHTEEHLHVLQIYSSMCSPPHTKNWTEISINTDVSVDTVRTALSQRQETLNEKLTKSLKDKLKETVSTELKRIQQYAGTVSFLISSHIKMYISASHHCIIRLIIICRSLQIQGVLKCLIILLTIAPYYCHALKPLNPLLL